MIIPHENSVRFELDRRKFQELCALQYNLREIAVAFDTTESALERAIRREYHRDPWAVMQQERLPGITRLRHKAWQLALLQGSVPMMIFLSKMFLGLSDKGPPKRPTPPVKKEPPLDLSRLTDEQFDELEQLARKIRRVGRPVVNPRREAILLRELEEADSGQTPRDLADEDTVLDLSRLTDAELDRLEELVEIAHYGNPSPPAAPAPPELPDTPPGNTAISSTSPDEAQRAGAPPADRPASLALGQDAPADDDGHANEPAPHS